MGYCEPAIDWDPAQREFEQEVLVLVNARRAEGANCGSEGSFAATGPLTMNGPLRCAARIHSLDMFERGFFNHTNPDNLDPFDRMELAGYDYSYAGENIAQGYRSAADVMTGWMNSDGHCRNIMSPNFTEIGVGMYEGFNWTQTFGRP